jgi:hypothetical protein
MNLTSDYTRVAVYDEWGPQHRRKLMKEDVRIKKKGRESNEIYVTLHFYKGLRERILSAIPPGTRFYATGINTMVGIDPDGLHVWKLSFVDPTKSIKNPAEYLAPVSVQTFTESTGDHSFNLYLAKFKKARTTEDRNLSPEEHSKLNDFVQSMLQKYAPPSEHPRIQKYGDWGINQVGLVDDQPVILDPENFYDMQPLT